MNQQQFTPPPAPEGGPQSYTHGERPGSTPAKPRPARVRVLDFLRGFSVLSMIAYHTMFDIVYMFGVDIGWYKGTPGYIWQQSICWVFILVSGASLHYGSKTLRRGFIVLACALSVSVATIVFMPSQQVMSGILHMLGVAMLISVPLMPLLKKIPNGIGFAVCMILFLLTKTVPRGYLGLGDLPLVDLPLALYQTPFLFPLGFPGPGFFSADYFPLLPWLFLFFAGYFGWGLLKGRAKLSPAGNNPLEWAGRSSLILYMVHQPVIYGVLMLLDKLGLFELISLAPAYL